MKSVLSSLVVVAALAGQASAQQAAPSGTEHNSHHPQAGQAQVTMPPSTSGAPDKAIQERMPSAQGGTASQGAQRPDGMMSGMGRGMGHGMGMGMGQGMTCPMMQGGMAGMPQGTMQMGQPRGDQSVGSLALNAINERMHREMAMEYTGNVDADFARGMIAHHQGAIDMAKVVAAFGKDAKIRELAQSIIKAQEDEIVMMKAWLAENGRQ